MKNKIHTNLLLFSLVAISSISYSYSYRRPQKRTSMLANMETMVKQMQEKIDALFSETDYTKMQKSDNSIMDIKNNNEQTALLFSLGKGIDTFNASMEDSSLIVEVPARNVKIIVTYDKQNHYLSVNTEWSVQQKAQDKTVQKQYAAQEQTHHGQTIDGILNFKKTKVEYENGVLAILMPKQTEKKKEAHTVHVEIK